MLILFPRGHPSGGVGISYGGAVYYIILVWFIISLQVSIRGHSLFCAHMFCKLIYGGAVYSVRIISSVCEFFINTKKKKKI